MGNLLALAVLCVGLATTAGGCSHDQSRDSRFDDLATAHLDASAPEDASGPPDLGPEMPDLAMGDMSTGPRWHEETSGNMADLLWVWGRNADDVWITGRPQIVLHSTTRGKKWDAVDVGVGQKTMGPVAGLGALDVYVMAFENTIFHSADGGKTWTSEHPDPNGLDCCEVLSALGNDVYAAGGGNVYHSSLNTPGVWTSVAYGKAWSISAVLPLPSGRVYIGTGFGYAWYSPDMLQSWVDVREPEMSIIRAFYSPRDMDLYAAGCDGFIVHTIDGGKKWQVQKPSAFNTGSCIRTIWGSSSYDIYATGFPPGYLHSSDGTKWDVRASPAKDPNTRLEHVWGTAADNVYIVGNNGLILHYY